MRVYDIIGLSFAFGIPSSVSARGKDQGRGLSVPSSACQGATVTSAALGFGTAIPQGTDPGVRSGGTLPPSSAALTNLIQ